MELGESRGGGPAAASPHPAPSPPPLPEEHVGVKSRLLVAKVQSSFFFLIVWSLSEDN